jgi:hypothetical protein
VAVGVFVGPGFCVGDGVAVASPPQAIARMRINMSVIPSTGLSLSVIFFSSAGLACVAEIVEYCQE